MLILRSSKNNAEDKIVNLGTDVLPVSEFQLPRLKADYD